MRRARVAVVGAGLMGRWHAQASQRLGAEIVGVVDPQREAADRLASMHRGALAFADLEAALCERVVDVVHVCTPVESHAALVEKALTSGCHVLVEKPLAASLPETETLLGMAGEMRLTLNPVHQLPFQPGFRSLLERRGRLGDLVRVGYRTYSAGGEGRSAPERRALLREILPHPVSLLHRLFGDSFEPDLLEVVRFTEDDLDLAGVLDGTRLDASISLRGRPTCNELQLAGTRATGLADLFHGYAVVESGGVSRPAKVLRPFRLGGQLIAGAGSNLARRGIRREPAYPGLRELVRLFHAASLAGGDPPIRDAETLAAARLMERVGAGG